MIACVARCEHGVCRNNDSNRASSDRFFRIFQPQNSLQNACAVDYIVHEKPECRSRVPFGSEVLLQHSNWTELLNALSHEPRLEFVLNVRCQFLVVFLHDCGCFHFQIPQDGGLGSCGAARDCFPVITSKSSNELASVRIKMLCSVL